MLMQPTLTDRLRAGVPSVVLTLMIGWALIAGLAVGTARTSADGLKLFDAPPPEPAVRVVPEPKASRRKAGEAAPPNIRSRATQVVAPEPVVPLPIPPIITAAPIAGPGMEASSGSTERPGPGTGAGGEGTGFGSGGDGDGDGGEEEGEFTPPRPRRGSLSNSDYPEAAADAGAQGVASVRSDGEVDGRVTGCRVTRSTGNAELDATTCRLITRRFRYYPSRDPEGRPVRSIVSGNHEWVLERVPDEDQ